MIHYPFDLAMGLDRSDCQADLSLIDPPSGKTAKQIIGTSFEALHAWLAQQLQSKVAVYLEQPATSLILFLDQYARITFYLINPVKLQKFREPFVSNRDQDDGKDAHYLTERGWMAA